MITECIPLQNEKYLLSPIHPAAVVCGWWREANSWSILGKSYYKLFYNFTDDWANEKLGGIYFNHKNMDVGSDGLIYAWTKFPIKDDDPKEVDYLFKYQKIQCKVLKKLGTLIARVKLTDGSSEQFDEEEGFLDEDYKEM